VPVLADGTVTLRAYRRQDIPAMVEQCRDEQMQRWTRVPSPYQARDARAYIDSRAVEWKSGRELSFAIATSNGYAGNVDLRPDGAGAADVGYALHPAARGRGVMSRALRLALGWGFEVLDLDVAHWRAQVGNWAGRRVAWAVGFRVEGTVRELLVHRDGRCDAWVGSLRRGEVFAPTHPWYEPAILTGRGVRLRPHRDDDLAAIVEACNDETTRHWLVDIPVPYTESDARIHRESVLADHAGGSAIYWAVADASDRMLAEIGLFGLRAGVSQAGEIGYWTHPGARCRGVMTEAARLVARHALLPREDGGLGLSRVQIRAATGNLASQRVALKAGFQPTGRDRQAERLRDGSMDDDLRYDLVAADLERCAEDRPDEGRRRGGRRR